MVLEAMRQPMEDGYVVISRARERVIFPTRFMFVAVANPCPCGYFGDKKKSCSCAAQVVLRYQKKISGPMLDRIDIHLDVPAVDVDKIISSSESESSASIRKRVIKARKKQQERFLNTHIFANADMSVSDMKHHCKITDDAKAVLKDAMIHLSLSARSYNKVIKVSRTIADLADEAYILPEHVLEALQYRARTHSVI